MEIFVLFNTINYVRYNVSKELIECVGPSNLIKNVKFRFKIVYSFKFDS